MYDFLGNPKTDQLSEFRARWYSTSVIELSASKNRLAGRDKALDCHASMGVLSMSAKSPKREVLLPPPRVDFVAWNVKSNISVNESTHSTSVYATFYGETSE
jgi:hypothetical protein